MSNWNCSDLSPRQRAILEIARQEAEPNNAHKFEPITNGFIFAAIGLGLLGSIAPIYLVISKVINFFGSGSVEQKH